MLRTIIASVFCLAVGIGIGRFLLPRNEGPPEGLQPGSESQVALREGNGPQEEDTAAGEATRAGPVSAPPPSGGSLENPWGDLPRIVEAVNIGPPPEADGVFRGKVITEEGTPLPGVRISVTPRTVPTTEDPSWPAEGIEREILLFVARSKWHKELTRNVRTAEDGSFRIRGLPKDLSYNITARLEGYRIKPKGRRETDYVRPDEEFTFIAYTIVEVPLSVLLPDGSPASAAWIKVEHGDHSDFIRWGEGDSAIGLRPGTSTLSADADIEGQAYLSDKIEVEVQPGEPIEPLVLRLKGEPGIQGKVVFECGAEPENMSVYCIPAPEGTRPEFSRGRIDSDHRMWVHAHSGFRFKFKQLSPGTHYLVVFWPYTRRIAAEAFVEVTDRMVHQDLKVPSLEQGTFFILWAFDPEGGLLSDISVSGKCDPSDRIGFVAPEARRDDGSFLLVLPWTADDPDRPQGNLFLRVSNMKYGKREITADPLRSPEIKVRFGHPARLTVRLTGPGTENPDSSFSVGLQPASDHSTWRKEGKETMQTALSSAEAAQLGPVDPGPYLVALFLKDSFLEEPVVVEPVALSAGQNEIELPAPALHDLVVRVPPSIKKLGIRSVASARNVFRLFDAENGRVVFRNLPPGTYRLITDAFKPKFMTVEVPVPGEITFEAEIINALRVVIRNPEGLLAKAGFKQDDIIIALDGKEFNGTEETRAAFRESMARGSIEATVLREGNVLKLTLPIVDNDPSEKKLGGYLDPTTRR